MSRSERPSEVPFTVRLVRARWRIVSLTLITMMVTVGATLLSPRAYEASATMAAVSPRQLPGLSGGLAASLLGNSALGGIQPTPGFLVRLSRMDGVLVRVAERPSPSVDWPGRLVDALAKRPAGSVPDGLIGRTMRRSVFSGFDTQTGLMTIRVLHTDTLVARETITVLVDELSAAFVRTSRAQATQLRIALESRLDSARGRLDAAQSDLVAFESANREVASYSRASLERQRLQREASIAERAYQEAASEREGAVAKELEATPAIVVLDPPARTLPPAPRGTAVRGLLAGVLAGLFGIGIVLFAAAAERSQDGESRNALSDLLRQSSVVRWLAGLAARFAGDAA